MKFYSLKAQKMVEVPNAKVHYKRTENGAKLAMATHNGVKLAKFVKK